jgi:hypothetical protein
VNNRQQQLLDGAALLQLPMSPGQALQLLAQSEAAMRATCVALEVEARRELVELALPLDGQ